MGVRTLPNLIQVANKSAPIYRSEQEVAELLQAFEEKTNAFRHQVNGVSIWQLLRFSVAVRLQNTAGPVKSRSVFEYGAAFLQSFKILPLIRTLSRTKIDFLFFSSYSGLRFKHKDGIKDIYVDDYISQLHGSAKVIIWNAVGFRSRLRNALRKPDYNFSGWLILSALIVRIFPSRIAMAECELLASSLSEILDLQHCCAKDLQKTVRSFLWNAAFYRIFLRIVRPKVCLVPDTSQHALMYACQSLGIKYVELQHGVFARNHPEALPLKAREALPGLLLPHAVALYGTYWKEALRGSLVSELKRDHAVGNPMLEHYRKIRQKRIKSSGYRLKLLFTTNGMDTANLVLFMEECLRVCSGEVILTIKLHPAYDPDERTYRALEDRFPGEVKVVSGTSDPNTFELMAEADLHLSIASACHYDSISIGTPTAIVGLEGHELVMDLVKGGHAVLVSSAAQLLDSLSLIRQGRFCIPSSRQEEFCMNFACDNLKSLINR